MRNPLARLRFARDHRWSQRRASEYIDAEMQRSESDRIEGHVSECADCRELIMALRTMVSTLATLPGQPAESVAGSVFAGVHERLAADAEHRG